MSAGAAPPGELLVRMVRTLGEVLALPLTAASWFAGTLGEAFGGGGRSTDPPLDNPVAPAGGPDKETDAMSDHWNNDEKLQLFEFTLVTVERGCERILDHGQRLVRDPTTEDEFKAEVIADYVSRHGIPRGAANNLRVAVRHLATWNKRPIHWKERQLTALENIAVSLGGDPDYDPCEPPPAQGAGGEES